MDNDVLGMEGLAVELGNAKDLGIGEGFTQLDEKLEKGSTLARKGCAAGIRGSEPGMREEGTAEADADRGLVVLVGVVDGTGDEVYRDADVGGREDKGFRSDDEVVSEVRKNRTIRLALTS